MYRQLNYHLDIGVVVCLKPILDTSLYAFEVMQLMVFRPRNIAKDTCFPRQSRATIDILLSVVWNN